MMASPQIAERSNSAIVRQNWNPMLLLQQRSVRAEVGYRHGQVVKTHQMLIRPIARYGITVRARALRRMSAAPPAKDTSDF